LRSSAVSPEAPSLRSRPRIRASRILVLALVALVLFLLGRHFAYRTIDFVVYHDAARSLLAGRTDLYSEDFAFRPPTLYFYPPLFVLLTFPLGWLPFADAFGLWLAGMALATGAIVLHAYRTWGGAGVKTYAAIVAMLAGPLLIYALRGGNAHLLVLLLTLAGMIAWSRRNICRAGFLIALAGSLKLFPLLLLPVFILRRDLKLILRVIAFSAILWVLPAAYFGPQRTVALYHEWYERVVGDVDSFARAHQLNHTLAAAAERWLSRVDYTQRYDGRYPQATLVMLPATAVRIAVWLLNLVVLGLSALGFLALRDPAANTAAEESPSPRIRVAAAASLFMTAQLLLGPYTTPLYLVGWLVPALALPCVLQAWAPRLNRLLLVLGGINVAVFVMPGSSARRVLEAYGAFAVVGLCLWSVSLLAALKFPRRDSLRPARSDA
jgi:hypothetical protein